MCEIHTSLLVALAVNWASVQFAAPFLSPGEQGGVPCRLVMLIFRDGGANVSAWHGDLYRGRELQTGRGRPLEAASNAYAHTTQLAAVQIPSNTLAAANISAQPGTELAPQSFRLLWLVLNVRISGSKPLSAISAAKGQNVV